jgi:hypothetical protein
MKNQQTPIERMYGKKVSQPWRKNPTKMNANTQIRTQGRKGHR